MYAVNLYFKLPEGYKAYEDCDMMYLCKDGVQFAVFNAAFATKEEILKACTANEREK